MSLPIRTTMEDIDQVCGYLTNKPIGATLAEARAIVDNKHLGGRKLAALKFWTLIEDDGNRIKITERGRQSVRNSGAFRSNALREVVRQVQPYAAVIERVYYRSEWTVTANEVAAHWYEHFNDAVSESEVTLNDQAICFFHVAQGADLGKLIIGRRGQPTRFDFDANTIANFVDASVDTSIEDTQHRLLSDDSIEVDELPNSPELDFVQNQNETDSEPVKPSEGTDSNRVFITHGKNLRILDEVKQIVKFGNFEPVVAMEHETTAKPVPEKVMGDMKTCSSAIIHVSVDRVLYDKDGNKVPQINENVLIEIGAAMAICGSKFILLVEEGVNLPSNLQGLYECRYKGEGLDMSATMKLLEAFNDFR